MSDPLVVEVRTRTEAGFGAWNAVQCETFGAGWTRGATDYAGVLTVPEPAQASVMLIDPDRDLDPGNPSAAYGDIDVGAELRLTHHGVVSFMGRIGSIEHDLSPGNPPIAKLTAVANLAKLAATKNQVNMVSAATNLQITAILDNSSTAIGGGERDIEAGGQTLIGGIRKADHWSLLVEIVHHEQGSIEFLPAGAIRTRVRGSMWPVTPPAPTLSIGCVAGAIPITEATFRVGLEQVRNDTWGKRAAGGLWTATDYTSRARYGNRYFERNALLFVDEPTVQAWATAMTTNSAYPPTTWTATIHTTNPTHVAAIENQAHMWARVRLTIDGYGTSIDLPALRLVGVEWSVDDTLVSTGKLTLGQDGIRGTPTLLSDEERADE